LATFGNLPSGRGYVHRRARRGEKPGKKKVFSLGTSPPKGSHIYLHTLFFFLPSFSLGIFMTLWTFFGNLRKSDNLCGPLAIPSQVYEHKGSNMMWQKHCIFRNVEKWGPDSVPFCIYIYVETV